MDAGESKSTGWCLIPPTILARKDLSVREKLLMGRILGLIDTNGYCYASNAWLGAQLDISKHTVTHLLTSLARKGLVSIALIKDDTGQITERRIYPLIQTFDPPFASDRVSSESARGVSSKSATPLVGIGERGIVEIGDKRGRDIGVEKREKKKAGEPSSPPAPAQEAVDRSGKGGPASTALSEQDAPSVAPPYLPRNFDRDHPVCRVLCRFADRWAAVSGEVLDVSVARAIREIQQRLKTTPLEDLLRLVELWFEPGLLWVSPAERGAFHTFIQPRAVSELKGIKAGLSTAPAGRRERAGYIRPLTHNEWARIPSGPVSFSQGRVVYHGDCTDGLAGR